MKKKEHAVNFYEVDREYNADQTEALLRAIQAGRKAREELRQGVGKSGDTTILYCTVKQGELCREKLILTYLPVLTVMAKRYQYRYGNLSTEDLIQEGTLGLLEAIDHYEGDSTNLDAAITNYVKRALARVIEKRRVIAFRMRRLHINLLVRLYEKKGKGDVQIPGKFFQLDLPREAFRLGLYLYYGSQYAPDGFLKADTICQAARLSRNQVTRCLELLRDAGVLRLSKGHIALYEIPVDRNTRNLRRD